MNNIEIDEIELLLDDDELNEIKLWLNNLKNEFDNKFSTKYDDIENIKLNIINKYKFYESNKNLEIKNNINISKNNIISIFYKKLRNEAIKYNIEKDISELIVSNRIFLICSVLQKHNMLYYDYIDKINTLELLHNNLAEKLIKIPYENMHDINKIIYWKNMLLHNNVDKIKKNINLIILSFLTNKKSIKNKKIISSMNIYFNKINSFFNKSFIDDYYLLNVNYKKE